MPTLTRRDFLKLTSQALLALSGLLGIGALLRFLNHPTEPPLQTEFDLGPASNYPPGLAHPAPRYTRRRHPR